MTRVRKAVIPAAGFGTRFLPATKSLPKEMLPLVDTPVIQYVVEEAVASGITDIVMVIGRGKRAIEEHFDRNLELERALEEKGKLAELERMRHISNLADIHFVWQRELNGLGDAVRCARHHVGDEPFAVLLGDTVAESPEPVTLQLIRLFEQYGESAVALEEVERAIVFRYGVMDGRAIAPGVFAIDDFVEKPAVEEAPSNLVIAGRYVFTPDIFDHIDQTPRGVNNEIQLTDAMRRQVAARAMYGLQFAGCRHDVGNKLDFVKANVNFALKHADLKADLVAFLKDVLRGE